MACAWPSMQVVGASFKRMINIAFVREWITKSCGNNARRFRHVEKSSLLFTATAVRGPFSTFGKSTSRYMAMSSGNQVIFCQQLYQSRSIPRFFLGVQYAKRLCEMFSFCV